MKHIIKKILTFRNLFISSFIIAINNVSAQTSVKITNPIATSDFSTLVGNVLSWVLGVAGSIALLMLIAGGVFYITSTGDEQRVETAKKMITWAILGLILTLASFSIIVVLDSILT